MMGVGVEVGVEVEVDKKKNTYLVRILTML
jgi:hypothetical protein